MDLSSCANIYGTLLGKDFILTLEDGRRIKLFFLNGHFYHLAGLHKLSDIPLRAHPNENNREIYNKIIRGEITQADIMHSKQYNRICDRLNCFEYLPKMLEKSKIIIDFNNALLGNRSVLHNTKYILYAKHKIGYIHLTIGEKKSGIYPESLFCENSKQYISEQTLLDIVKVEVIKRK